MDDSQYERKRPRRSRAALLVASLIASMVGAVPPPPAGASHGSCDRYADSSSGNDTNSGTTPQDAFLTSQRLIDSLAEQDVSVGCLKGNFPNTSPYPMPTVMNPGLPGKRDVLTSTEPGDPARMMSGLRVLETADNVAISNLIFMLDQPQQQIEIYAADTLLENNDITRNGTPGTCVLVGDDYPQGGTPEPEEMGEAANTTIVGNLIHGCGFSGGHVESHGIWLHGSQGAEIRNNYIYDNGEKGILLYPDGDGTRAWNNVIYGNGEGISFGGECYPGQQVPQTCSKSEHNQFDFNIISNSVQRANVGSSFPPSFQSALGNIVDKGCVFSPKGYDYGDFDNEGVGYSQFFNLTSDPRFAGAANGDFSLLEDSPCRQLEPSDSIPDVRAKGVLPTVTTFDVIEFDATHALLSGTINPHWQPASYHFAFGTTADGTFTQQGFGVPERYGLTTPVTPVGSGHLPIEVSVFVSGLRPGATYSARLVGTNAAGDTYSGSFGSSRDNSVEFTTPAEPTPTCNGKVATVVQRPGQSKFSGTPGPDVIVAFDGVQNITGGGGKDIICGGAGNDVISGGAGNDTLFGGVGDKDLLSGGPGNDLMIGSTAPQVVETDSDDGADYLGATQGVTANLTTDKAFGEGTDTLRQLTHLRGSRFADTLTGDIRRNRILGLEGNDKLFGEPLSSTDGDDDKLIGGKGNDRFYGGPGDFDLVDYTSSATAVNIQLARGVGTGEGRDLFLSPVEPSDCFDCEVESLQGSRFGDKLYGSSRSDDIGGGGGADVILGGGANDVIRGGNGNDTIVGGSQDDNLLGNGHSDIIRGAGGDDLILGDFPVTPGQTVVPGDDAIDGGNGGDMVGFIGAGDSSTGVGVNVDLIGGTATGPGIASDTLINVEDLFGSPEDDKLVGDDGQNLFEGALGDDSIDGNGGTDLASYNSVACPITANLATGLVTFPDPCSFGSPAVTDTLEDVEGIEGTVTSDSITGNAGDNLLVGGGGQDTLVGGDGNDFFLGDYSIRDAESTRADDTIDGGLGTMDVVSYFFAQSQIELRLGTGLARGEGLDQLSGIEGAEGSQLGAGWFERLGSPAPCDPLTQTEIDAGRTAQEVLEGEAGVANWFWGEGGNDQICGGTGADHIDGGPNDDLPEGGDAVLSGGDSGDRCANFEYPTGETCTLWSPIERHPLSQFATGESILKRLAKARFHKARFHKARFH